MVNIIIPKRFRERYSDLTDDTKQFFEFLEKPLSKSFRVNTIKAKREGIVDNFEKYGVEINPVKWHPDAFITNNFNIGNSIEHFMGHIYIQELTSMLPVFVASERIRKSGLVLDCCAAPGSKTTQIAAVMENKGCIIANDINYARIKALKFNMEKTGVLNTIITNHDFRFFDFPEKFDDIILDAPCTSEGTVRKDWKVLTEWSERKIFGVSRLQKSLILRAFDLLKSGGQMIYSTCTFAPEENEEVVDYLLKNRKGVDIEKINIDGFKLSSGIGEWGKKTFDPEVQKTSRIWPHHNDTGGFFMAKVRKV